MSARSTAAVAAERSRLDHRLLPMAAATWGAAWWAVGSPLAQVEQVALLAAAATVLLLTLALLLRRCGVRRVAAVAALAALTATLVLATVAVRTQDRRSDVVTDAIAAGTPFPVELVVAGDPRAAVVPDDQPWRAGQIGVRATVRHMGTTAGSDGDQLAAPVHLTGGEAWAAVRWGERVGAVVTLAAAPPGAPFVAFARARADPELLAPAAWQWRAAERLRGGLRTAAGVPPPQDLAVVPDGAALLPGLVVGDTSAVSTELAHAMRVAGLAHLTAVSGSNVTLVCGGAVLLAALARAGPRTRAGLGALTLLALVVVARPEPSVLRAAAMGAVGLAALALGRRGGGLPALALAVVAVLVADPWLARSPGLRLSVAATAGLVVLAAPLSSLLGRVLPRPVAVAIAVPAVAQVAVTPVLLGLEPTVAPYALPANVLAAVAVPPATVLGLLAALLSLLDPGLAALVATPGRWAASWIALVGRSAAGLPGAELAVPAGSAVLAVSGGVAGLLVLAVLLATPRLAGRATLRARWGALALRWVVGARRGTVLAGMVTVAVALAVVSCGPVPGRADWPGENWRVLVCDVGQGDALAVRVGRGSAVVVDAGPTPELVSRCLATAGVTDIPLVVLTHFHADHVDGLSGVLAGRRAGQLWHSPLLAPAAAVTDVRETATAAGVEQRAVGVGTRARVGDAVLTVLSPSPRRVADATGPPAGAAAGSDSPDSAAVNDTSLVLLVELPELVLLVLGDVGLDPQRELLRRHGETLPADVVTVAHHGSAEQEARLYDAVAARLAVVSAGRDNPYGHPTDAALAIVESSGAVTASTTRLGTLVVIPQPDGGLAVRGRGS